MKLKTVILLSALSFAGVGYGVVVDSSDPVNYGNVPGKPLGGDGCIRPPVPKPDIPGMPGPTFPWPSNPGPTRPF